MDHNRPRSYWTVRRKIRKAVQQHMSDISQNCVRCAVTSETYAVHEQSVVSSNTSISCVSSSSADLIPETTDSNEACLCSDWSAAGPSTPSVDSDFDVSGDSDDSLCADELTGLPERLADWARNFGIHLNALSALLSILHDDHPCLPKDARTLLGTVNVTGIRNVAGGEYYHFGLKSAIVPQILSGCLSANTCISVQVNIDGLPLFKSSNVQFWPILGMIDSEQMKCPFAIGVFCGTGKPTSLSDFLLDFVDECKILEKDGFLLAMFTILSVSLLLFVMPQLGPL
jgi:hypothetical protein